MNDHVELVKGIYDGFARGDVPGVLSRLDPNVEWVEAEGYAYADGNPYTGPDRVLHGIFMRLATDWDGFVVRATEILPTPTGALSMGRYAGTYKASGRSIDAQFAHVWRIANGKVTAFQQFTDTAQFANAMK
jgi:ketosteroid isomerase-like protein